MTVQTDVTVRLAESSGCDLEVKFDRGSTLAVDFSMGADMVSTSLDEAEEFARELLAFVEHYRTATR